MADLNDQLDADPWEGDVPPMPEPESDPNEALAQLFVPGGSFVLDVPETPPSVWGSEADVLWAEGEALMIAAPQGAGKTTVAFQVVRARLGLQDTVLGLPVTPGERVLYLAMDRPAQAQRAAHRLFVLDDREFLNDRLVFWKGPPPFDLAKRPEILVAMCERAKADTVVIDSLKDAAIGLSDDEVGAGYNRARQKALTEGVQVLELHHNRKAGTNGGEPNTISDVYGSVWLTSGTGSVISLYGDPGDPVVSFRHLKQPMNEVGPFRVVHDHPSGTSSVQQTTDLIELVRNGGPEGLTAKRAAEDLFETNKPTPAQVEKARRRLEKLHNEGFLLRHNGASKTSAATYYLQMRSVS
ncbi:AAA family ATPase [Streptomyces sp. NPDC052225]|uniref:AAA family ATPase n=1 Tax=Streptomyces sp. NPDC052225 TaxID=3154949 RepID=UPI0034236498